MLENLVVYNFKNHAEVEKSPSSSALFLKTCQRVLVIELNHQKRTNQLLFNHEKYTGTDAYHFLLEVICGLKSKLVGENEIVGQFRDAYKAYCQQPIVDTGLLVILEKLFKDAKEIRSKYLMGLCQKTYASIARKHMINRHKAQEILILGSGYLAEDLINQFKKKSTVFISARNFEKVNELANKHDLQIIPWKNTYLFLNFSHIANTIGAKEIILDEHFFNQWSQKHNNKFFVDLSSGECMNSPLNYTEGFMTLKDIFAEGAISENRKKDQLKLAQLKMTEIVEKRYIHLKQKKLDQMQYGVLSEKAKAI